MPTFLSNVEDDDQLSADAAFFARTRPHLFLAMVRVHVLEHMIDSGMRYKLLEADLSKLEDYFDFRRADRTLEALQFEIECQTVLMVPAKFRYKLKGR